MRTGKFDSKLKFKDERKIINAKSDRLLEELGISSETYAAFSAVLASVRTHAVSDLVRTALQLDERFDIFGKKAEIPVSSQAHCLLQKARQSY